MHVFDHIIDIHDEPQGLDNELFDDLFLKQMKKTALENSILNTDTGLEIVVLKLEQGIFKIIAVFQLTDFSLLSHVFSYNLRTTLYFQN